jgi:hypothetical protein
MKTTIMAKNPTWFDMTGKRLATTLRTLPGSISAGLATRLHRYAVSRLKEAGFAVMVEGWEVEVYTLDGEDLPADRSYCVKFENTSGGYIEVVGILTDKGWPNVGHGFEIGQSK